MGWWPKCLHYGSQVWWAGDISVLIMGVRSDGLLTSVFFGMGVRSLEPVTSISLVWESGSMGCCPQYIQRESGHMGWWPQCPRKGVSPMGCRPQFSWYGSQVSWAGYLSVLSMGVRSGLSQCTWHGREISWAGNLWVLGMRVRSHVLVTSVSFLCESGLMGWWPRCPRYGSQVRGINSGQLIASSLGT